MCNHARGLWGYSGRTPGGDELTIQSTGIGGPSAALVLADLAELGVQRAIRVGSCVATGAGGSTGELILVERAVASRGSAAAFGLAAGEAALPDPGLTESLRLALGDDGRPGAVASFDMPPATERAARRRSRRRRHADGRRAGSGSRRSGSAPRRFWW